MPGEKQGDPGPPIPGGYHGITGGAATEAEREQNW